MNRRSFFAFLIGAPIAAVTGWKSKPINFASIWKMIDLFRSSGEMPIFRTRFKPAEWEAHLGETWDYEKLYSPSRGCVKSDFTFGDGT
jgi:hypothetical protein